MPVLDRLSIAIRSQALTPRYVNREPYSRMWWYNGGPSNLYSTSHISLAIYLTLYITLVGVQQIMFMIYLADIPKQEILTKYHILTYITDDGPFGKDFTIEFFWHNQATIGFDEIPIGISNV